MAVAHWVKGDPVDISSGVHVVEFWATWCPPCRTSIPHLTEIQEKFADRGVKIIGVSKEKLGTVEPFVEKMGDKMAYTVAIDGGVAKDYMGKYNIGGTLWVTVLFFPQNRLERVTQIRWPILSVMLFLMLASLRTSIVGWRARHLLRVIMQTHITQ